jgi:DNA polymerase-3 subunit alpha (Gram-positive type)
MVYTVVDIETTGLSRYAHRITEIGAVQLRGGVVRNEFHTLVNPGVPIPSFITRLTGITNAMVKDAPPVDEAVPKFVRFLGDDVFVAHNAAFDYGFLQHNAQRNKLLIKNDVLCTRRLATRLLPELPSKRLGALCTHFDITNEQAHRAMADAHATAHVLTRFSQLLKERGIEDPREIVRFATRPRSTILRS